MSSKQGHKNKRAMLKKQLGMDIHTASKRLERRLLLDFAKRCGMDICFRCNLRIESVKDLHIDHKEPYLHKSNAIELFEDINNIALSHAKCNSSAKRRPSIVRATSGFKGVRKSRSSKNPWECCFYYTVDGKSTRIYCGCYSTAKEAAEIYDLAAVEHLGDRAVTNRSLGLL